MAKRRQQGSTTASQGVGGSRLVPQEVAYLLRTFGRLFLYCGQREEGELFQLLPLPSMEAAVQGPGQGNEGQEPTDNKGDRLATNVSVSMVIAPDEVGETLRAIVAGGGELAAREGEDRQRLETFLDQALAGAKPALRAALEEQLGRVRTEPPPEVMAIPIPSARPYHELRRAVALGEFEAVAESRYPRAQLTGGYAELRSVTPEQEPDLDPYELESLVERMQEQRAELSDRDVDVLDLLSAAWIQQTRSPTDSVRLEINELLAARGLVPKAGGEGRRGGYREHQRRSLWESLSRIQDLWLDLGDVEYTNLRGRRRKAALQSRPFLIGTRLGQRRLEGGMDVATIFVRPGEGFAAFLYGPGRQIALLSSKALAYDPMRQAVEKRMARYLAWQWRIRQGEETWQRFKVGTLLRETGLDLDRPARTRERLEKALDRLHEDGVTGNWQYEEGFREEDLPRKGWGEAWTQVCLEIRPPREVLHLPTTALALEPPKRRRSSGRRAEALTLGSRLREVRESRGLSQSAAAREIGISQPYIAQLETGRRLPSAAVEERIRTWLE